MPGPNCPATQIKLASDSDQGPTFGRLLRRLSALVDVWQHLSGIAFTASPSLTPRAPEPS